MERIRKEKSILGQISDLSHKLVIMLVIPIIISLVLMLFYAWKYHSAIRRMGEITELKAVVSEDIPEKEWMVCLDKMRRQLYLMLEDVVRKN